jgi:hypothetical protein
MSLIQDTRDPLENQKRPLGGAPHSLGTSAVEARKTMDMILAILRLCVKCSVYVPLNEMWKDNYKLLISKYTGGSTWFCEHSKDLRVP